MVSQKLLVRAAVGTIVVGAGVYFWLLFTRWDHLGSWGSVGDAVAPFGSLLTAAALFAALYSVALQRSELRLQRKELKATRDEMKAQREEFKKTAKAQADLVLAQQDLANAQKAANALMPYQELAQRRATLAALNSLVATIDIARADSRTRDGSDVLMKYVTEEPRTMAQTRTKEEGRRIILLERQLGIDTHLESDENGNQIYVDGKPNAP
jgi:hypothetical protein